MARTRAGMLLYDCVCTCMCTYSVCMCECMCMCACTCICMDNISMFVDVHMCECAYVYMCLFQDKSNDYFYNVSFPYMEEGKRAVRLMSISKNCTAPHPNRSIKQTLKAYIFCLTI